jgi:hypothetical protein
MVTEPDPEPAEPDGAEEEELETLEEFEGVTEAPDAQPQGDEVLVGARKAVRLAIAWFCEGLAKGAADRKHARHPKIIKQIRAHLPDEIELEQLGREHLDLRSISPFVSGQVYRLLLNDVPKLYARFRRSLVQQQSGYLSGDHAEDIRAGLLSSAEEDLLVCTMLRNVHEILEDRPELIDRPRNNRVIENVVSEFRTQVLIDEATDFSPVQLASMFCLSDPRLDAVSLSGDLMQRITPGGISSWDECEFFSEDFQKFTLQKNYRQSARLLGVAGRLYELEFGDELKSGSAYQTTSADVPPLQFRTGGDETAASEWLVERILEIYELHGGHLPSVAIIVPEESDIRDLYEQVEPSLDHHSIPVEMCADGKVGDGSRVRIFSVDYIKGLEFEAAFLIDVDRLERLRPGLASRYLYVALTRAARFLGVTYASRLPTKLSGISDAFEEGGWADDERVVAS